VRDGKHIAIEQPVAGKVTVYILTASRLLRGALERILRRASFEIIGSAEDGGMAFEQIAAQQPNLLLIDAGALPSDCAAPVIEARRVAPGTRVVLFGARDDRDSFFRSIQAGVVGYLSTECSAADVLAAARLAVRGEALCPPKLCLELFNYVRRQTSIPRSRREASFGLTRREQQLLPLISEGLTNKEIAVRLSISEVTVKNHVSRILRKTGKPDRLSAARAAEPWSWDLAINRFAGPRLGCAPATGTKFPDGELHQKCNSIAWIRTQERSHEHVKP
jgi:two-component system response regulator DevR